MTAFLWPLGYWLASRFHPVLFPLLSFNAMALTIVAARWIVELADAGSFVVAGYGWALLVAIGLTIGNTVLGAFYSVDDDAAYARFVIRPLRLRYAAAERQSEPGILFLEIDGLAEPVLRQALDAGYMPTLHRWLIAGSHTLRAWEPDLSSQTSASQAGILLGSNDGIPAFRWWDKQRGRLMVSSKMSTAEALEEALSTGNGLLARGGGSRFNVFSGDAADCVATFSRIGRAQGIGQFEYILYFTNPYTLFRTLSLFIADVVRERWQAHRQRALDVQPRIKRGLGYAFVRASTTALLQEAACFMLIADILRGVPSAYVTFFAYDEVAHHSGIDRADAFKVLKRLDRIIALLERVTEQAPRPYRIIVLSDHGQSMGATFRQRYGQTLAELVEQLLAGSLRVSSPEAQDEGLGQLNAGIAQAIHYDSRTARLATRALQGQMRDGELALGSRRRASESEQFEDVVVLASGNLGLISFTRLPERLSYEQLVDQFPNLLQGLINHPGIGFIVVRSDTEGGLVLGSRGIYYLDHDYAAGENPLAHYGRNAARHLMRNDGFHNAPDILVMSAYDPATGDVAAFEELVGCHGGLGGPQTQPFLLYPNDLPHDPTVPIVGAAALHAVLLGWVNYLQPRQELHEPSAA
ncbi:MAG: hypothetical protein DCC58_13355 [Chloroflexi bacterium]|nr:MAG: hypothetical protein DCC58_13355 [Chloroflexota bacterium]